MCEVSSYHVSSSGSSSVFRKYTYHACQLLVFLHGNTTCIFLLYLPCKVKQRESLQCFGDKGCDYRFSDQWYEFGV